MNQNAFCEYFFRNLKGLWRDCNSPFNFLYELLKFLPIAVWYSDVIPERDYNAAAGLIFLLDWFLVFVTFHSVMIIGGALWVGYRAAGYDTIKRSPGYRAKRLSREEREFLKYCHRRISAKKEVIIASAIVDKEGSVWYVMRPGRHHHCIWHMAEHDMNKQIEQQGFLTNRFRFLGRQDARALAIRNGQCPNPAHSTDLFSEDLWKTPPHLAQKA